MSRPNFGGQFYHAIVTIDEQLYWSIMFNERLYSVQFVREMKQDILEFFDKLIEQ